MLMIDEPRKCTPGLGGQVLPQEHKGRLGWVDASRGVVMLMVLVLHVCGYEYLSDVNGYSGPALRFWDDVNQVFSAARMPALFIISGWLAATSMSKGFGFARNRRRILTNAWLLVLWTVIYALLTVAVGGQNMPNSVIPSTVVLNIVLPNSTLWFLAALVWYTVLLTALRHVPPLLVVAGLFCLSAYTITFWTTETGLWVKLPQFGLFFALGAYAKAFFGWVAGHPAIVLPISLAGTVMSMWWQSYQSEHQEWGYFSFLAIAVFLPLFIFALCGCLCEHAARLAAPLESVGRNTVLMYLLHFPVLLVIVSIAPVHELVIRLMGNELMRWIWPLVLTMAIAMASVLLKKRIEASRCGWLLMLPGFLDDLAASGIDRGRQRIPGDITTGQHEPLRAGGSRGLTFQRGFPSE